MDELRNRLKRARHMASAIRAKHDDFEWDRANEVVKEINAVLALLPEEREEEIGFTTSCRHCGSILPRRDR